MTHARAYDGTAQRSRRFQCHGKVWSGRTTAVLNGPDTHEGRGLPTSFDTRAVMEEPQAEKAVESAPSAAHVCLSSLRRRLVFGKRPKPPGITQRMSCQPVPTTRNISVNDHTLKTTKATAVTPKATNCGALVGERIQTRSTIPGAKRKTPVNVTRMPHEVRRVLFATKLFTSGSSVCRSGELGRFGTARLLQSFPRRRRFRLGARGAVADEHWQIAAARPA